MTKSKNKIFCLHQVRRYRLQQFLRQATARNNSNGTCEENEDKKQHHVSYLWKKESVDLTDRLLFSVRVYCNRSQMTSQGVKNKKVRHERKLSGVTVVLYTL